MECVRSIPSTALQFAFVKFPQDLVESLEDTSKEWSLQVSADGEYTMYMTKGTWKSQDDDDDDDEEGVQLNVAVSKEDIENEYYSMGHLISNGNGNRFSFFWNKAKQEAITPASNPNSKVNS